MPDRLMPEAGGGALAGNGNGEAELFGPSAALLGGYRPLPGVRDEMIDESGALRPHWRGFIAALSAIGNREINRRFDAAERHMREADVFYRVFEQGAAATRPWPMSPAPLLIAAEEWEDISAGMVQRAALLEAVLRDAYGPQRLVADKLLPAAVIAGSPEFLRPLVGVEPKGGLFLRFYAADLGRGPDGRWWVIGDRAQAPSGAGYALENRIVLSRTLPDVFRDLDIERLAGFFGGFRASLSAMSQPGSAGVCLLTPGPLSETYFEHAYLARYLGFLLIEGEDLTVRHDEVFLRTVAGLRKADVLLRRLDADFADPLELNAHSRIGAPGLVRAARAGHVAIANALGAGLVESRALMGFLPAIAEKVLGASLKLPNTATWWCGQTGERDHVLSRLDDMAIAPAFQQTGAAPFTRGAIPGSGLDAAQRASLTDALTRRGVDYVGQEVVRLSTTPVWENGHFAPRPFVLRVFVAATEDGGWQVMPGGFARVSEEYDPRAVSMQYGGRSADVWVMAKGPVEQTSLLRAPDDAPIRRHIGALTSRAADNLFWLGRYIERIEAMLRMVRALAGRAAERHRETRGIVDRVCNMLTAWGAAAPHEGRPAPAEILLSALTRADLFGSAPALVSAARGAASNIRDRLSPDAWRSITDLAALFDNPTPPATEADAFEIANSGLRVLAAFSGLAQENMVRATGWRFLEIGRRIERAIAVSRFVRAFADDNVTPASIDLLLELGDSQITYAQRYFLTASRTAAVDLLVLDPNNPRSCAFQVERLREHIDLLPGHKSGELLTHCQRMLERLATELHVTDAGIIDEEFLGLQEDALMALSDAVSERYLINRERVAGPPQKADE